jgi:hypothetical protein
VTCSSSSKVVASYESEENKRIQEKIAMITDISHPKCEFWTNRSKAVTVAKFEYQAEKFIITFISTMVWKTMFPLDPAPETLSALFNRFKTPARI